MPGLLVTRGLRSTAPPLLVTRGLSPGAKALSAAPYSLSPSTTTTVNFTGTLTTWLSTPPTFTPSGVAGVSVGAVTVVSDTSAHAAVTTGATTGTGLYTDSTTGATAGFSVGSGSGGGFLGDGLGGWL